MTPYIIVVDNPKRWNLGLEEVPIVAARDYLSDPQWSAPNKRLHVLNLCRSYRYQNAGYYVSLLAEARGHKVQPSVATIQDFKSQSIIKSLAGDLHDKIQTLLKPLQSDRFTLSIYFARNLAKRYVTLSRDLYNLFPSPLLRATFQRHEGEWSINSISPIAWSEVSENHRPFVIDSAREFFKKRILKRTARTSFRYDMAILVDAKEPNPPSNEDAIKAFEKAANSLEIGTDRITVDDYGSIGEYDALFIRTTTAVNHYTYRFARKAQAEGLVVIDNPRSILRCGNKVFLQEILSKNKLPAPPTRILHRDNANEVLKELGLPCILKQPDSAFSLGVVKVDTVEEYRQKVSHLLDGSDLLIAQAFVPTQFDWRIGIIENEALYACCYYMAAGHWQIYNHAANNDDNVGIADAVPLHKVPPAIMDAAIKSSRLIGDGLYGVDLKELNGKAFVIEVNDNPSIDFGIEDACGGPLIYRRIMQYFLKRLETRHQLK
jgi:glutathione synthase/RimK-type ligase-like ATP-grasp enzyme